MRAPATISTQSRERNTTIIDLTDFDLARINETARRETAFDDIDDLLNAKGGYRPTLNLAKRGMRELADYYDRMQEIRRDSRRAHRINVR